MHSTLHTPTQHTQVRDKSAVLSLLQEELADVQRENALKDEAIRKLTAKLKEEQQTHMMQVAVCMSVSDSHARLVLGQLGEGGAAGQAGHHT
jgi:hypothetical protein